MASLRCGLVLLLTFVLCRGGNYDYNEAIYKSLLFYQAQRSGYLWGMDPLVSWRKDSGFYDYGWYGEDLIGGYYDAGDFVKFGFPMAFTITGLSWGAIDYEYGYTLSGQLGELRNAIKWGTDYFLKAHVSEFEFYGQVGNGEADHAYWGRPEDMSMERPAYKITTGAPGSDLAGETAAALAAASIVFRNVDGSYADTLLTHAKQLYNFADWYRGKYSDSIPDANNFYSSSSYEDELVWGAAWLFRATGDYSYLSKAEAYVDQFGIIDRNGYGWDDKSVGAVALLAKLTGEQRYKDKLKGYCDWNVYNVGKTPNGLLFVSEWGSIHSALNIMYICMQAADVGISPDVYRNFAKSQVDYALGDGARSFVGGFGNNPPTHMHHRSASCPDAPAACTYDTYFGTQPNYHVLYGALVGGPDANDGYDDVRSDYVKNEVACDYNVSFQGILAALKILGY